MDAPVPTRIEGVQDFLNRADRDAAQLGQILQLYWNYLHLLAASQMDRRLRVRCSPSDLVQETFLEAHRDFWKFRGSTEREFLGWLRQILVNNLVVAARRHLEAAKRDVRREVSVEQMRADLDTSGLCLAALLAQTGTSPSSRLQREELLVALADSMAELPQHYREVLILRHLQGRSFPEIAGRLERGVGAVRMLWLRAIGQLRARLSSRGLL
jgi:RNA polymerase sigma-70 factor (ECF subfamily)